jgi:hypothetical protein
MSKVTKTEPPKAGPLTLLATLDRDELEAALATAEQELEALVVERRRSIDAIRLFLKAARIRDGIEVRKKPVKKLKLKTQSVMAGNSDDGSDSAKGGGVRNYGYARCRAQSACGHRAWWAANDRGASRRDRPFACPVGSLPGPHRSDSARSQRQVRACVVGA